LGAGLVSAAKPRSAVAVLLGGPSAEHDVSLVSGRAITAALAERGYAVDGWLIDLDGRWWCLPPSAMDRELPQTAYDDPASLGAEGPLTAAAALERLAGSDPQPVVFPALHGPFGEDGTLQALLESTGLAYCGSGPAASCDRHGQGDLQAPLRRPGGAGRALARSSRHGLRRRQSLPMVGLRRP